MLIANVGNGKRTINTDLMGIRRTINIAINMDEMHQFLVTTTYKDPQEEKQLISKLMLMKDIEPVINLLIKKAWAQMYQTLKEKMIPLVYITQ